jgi:hypothetical protein
LIANIERFLTSLFASGPRPEETTRYADAMRRGAVLLRVDAASESHAELARNTLTRLGAIDVHQQEGSWESPTPDANREHSVLDELGIGSRAPAATAARPDPYRTAAFPVDPSRPGDPLTGTSGPVDPLDEPVASTSPVNDPLTRTTPLPDPMDPRPRTPGVGGFPSGGAIPRPDEPVPDATPDDVPDEFLEYEEDFRNHYDELYANEGTRYEEYRGAYRYGATIGRDDRYRDMHWNDIEPDARRDWEKTSAGDGHTWERFKAAVRHGWDRVTGHHHHPL